MTDANVKMYAIAVRDDQLRLFLRIARRPTDIYVIWPRDNRPGWNPHASYHASGQRHGKAFGSVDSVKHLQEPDERFQGSANITTVGIASDEVSAMPLLDAADFDAVFEIPANELKPQMYHTNVSIDLTDTSAEPTIWSGAKILRDAIFDDVYPWIVVTLFDTNPDDSSLPPLSSRRGSR